MKDILKGIGKTIAQFWKVDAKTESESLEDKINSALAEEKEKITPTKDDIDWYSWVTKDNNPIHRLKQKAIKLGFKDIPLMGAHVSAYGEQFIEGVVKNMREYWGADIKIIGQKNYFISEVNPGDKIHWQVTGYKECSQGIKLFTRGEVKSNRVIEITSKLGKEYPLMPQIAGPIINASKRYLIKAEHLEAFYNCVGGKLNGEVPNMLPASFIPATLLALLEEKTQTSEGMNIMMDFDFLRKAKPGIIQVDLYPPRKPKSQQRIDKQTKEPIINPITNEPIVDYNYKFKSVVSQDNNPVTYGEIICSTNYKVNF